MNSIREQILAESLSRLVAAPAYPYQLARPPRRVHITNITRENSPTISQEDGADDRREGAPGSRNICAQPRDVQWRICIYTRNDEVGHLHADAIMLDVMRRMNPATAPWPVGVTVAYGAIEYDNEIADEDVTKLDIRFTARYQTEEWRLNEIATS